MGPVAVPHDEQVEAVGAGAGDDAAELPRDAVVGAREVRRDVRQRRARRVVAVAAAGAGARGEGDVKGYSVRGRVKAQFVVSVPSIIPSKKKKKKKKMFV